VLATTPLTIDQVGLQACFIMADVNRRVITIRDARRAVELTCRWAYHVVK